MAEKQRKKILAKTADVQKDIRKILDGDGTMYRSVQYEGIDMQGFLSYTQMKRIVDYLLKVEKQEGN